MFNYIIIIYKFLSKLIIISLLTEKHFEYPQKTQKFCGRRIFKYPHSKYFDTKV